MKNSKFLKLISLALTVALLVAVAVPTLVTSAEDTETPEYVRNVFYDFEDGERHSNNGSVADVGVNDSKGLNIVVAGSPHEVFFTDTYMKAGNTYLVMFDYYCYNSGTDNYAWFNQVCDTNNTQYGNPVGYANNDTAWRKYSKQITVPKDTKFGIVTSDAYYIDNLYIFDLTNDKWYQAADNNLDLPYEGLILPEGSNTVQNVFDEESNSYVTVFNPTNYSSNNGAYVPFNFVAGKKYNIGFEFYSDGTNGTPGDANNPHVFRVTCADASDANIQKTEWCYPSPATTLKWTAKSFVWTATADCTGLHFDAGNSGGGYTTIKIRNAYIVEMSSSENTATKQTYTFDTHDFTYSGTTGKSLSAQDKDGGKTVALAVNCSGVAEIQPKLDFALTAKKIYKLSYDYKGKGNIALSFTNGAWGSSQYNSEMIGELATCITVNTDEWIHREAVFCAEYASTHMFIRGSEGEKVYIDNLTIEEYDGYKDKEVLDFETERSEYNNYRTYNNYSVVADPTGADNKVLKSSNAGYKPYYIPSMRLQKGHTYYVTFDYYVPALPEGQTSLADYYAFALETRNQIGGSNDNSQYLTRNIWVNPKAPETWQTFKTTVKITTDEQQGALFSIFCRRTTYFDNIKITDVTDVLDAETPNLDYGSEDSFFLESDERTSVTKEADEEQGLVTKIAFNEGTSTTVGKVSVPFRMGADKTYVVKITYKTNAWVAFSWTDKALGENGLNGAGDKWVTETRYAKGTNGDYLYFYSNPGTELYIADITITEATEAGGLNGDGVIDATDYELMRNRFFAAKRDDSKQFEKYADQDGSGTVDILDMVLLSKIGK